MKQLLLIMLAALPLTSMAQDYDDDDMYFTSSRKAKTTSVTTQNNSRTAARSTSSYFPSDKVEPVVYGNSTRSDDEYNRRTPDNNTFKQVITEEGDTVLVDINDDEVDYRYSRRLLRFHSPRVVVALSSPLYWDLVYGCRVYDYLDDFFWYDPFVYHWGWGFGWSYSCWYGPMWGFHYGHHWAHWGYGPAWCHWGRPVHHYNYRPLHHGSGFSIGRGMRNHGMVNGISSRNGRAFGTSAGRRSNSIGIRGNNAVSSYTPGRTSLGGRNTASVGNIGASRNTGSYNSNRGSYSNSYTRYNPAANRGNNTGSMTNRTTTTRSNNSYSAPTRSYSGSGFSGGGFSGGSRGGGGFSGGGSRGHR